MNVRRSVEDPMFDAQVNVLGTLNVLEQASKHGARKVIFHHRVAQFMVNSWRSPLRKPT